jgi:hypothetical protein
LRLLCSEMVGKTISEVSKMLLRHADEHVGALCFLLYFPVIDTEAEL